MSRTVGHQKREPTVRFASEYTNFPEVSGTSLPLLATVLAGFAVTNIVQLMMRPDVTEALPFRVVLALVAFLLATLCFLSSTIFAVNAQAHNYLPFIDIGEDATQRLQIEDVEHWIRSLERGWYIYHVAAIASFYSGVILLLAGINLVVWVFVGMIIAWIFLAAVAITLGIVLGVGMMVSRRGTERPVSSDENVRRRDGRSS